MHWLAEQTSIPKFNGNFFKQMELPGLPVHQLEDHFKHPCTGTEGRHDMLSSLVCAAGQPGHWLVVCFYVAVSILQISIVLFSLVYENNKVYWFIGLFMCVTPYTVSYRHNLHHQ